MPFAVKGWVSCLRGRGLGLVAALVRFSEFGDIMIEKVSEIREQFIAKESQRVEGIKMPHMPTLGSAYEEITRQGIDFNLVLSINELV